MKFKVEGMHCTSCEKIIEKKLLEVSGVKKVNSSYPNNSVDIMFDELLINKDEVKIKLNEIGYPSINQDNGLNKKKEPIDIFLGVVWGLIGFFIIAYFISQYKSFSIPAITANMGYGLIFLVGLLTGLHCVSMCGGFVLSYTAKDAAAGRSSYKSHFMYGAGKTLSYTFIGALFGLLGSIVAFTPQIRGFAGIISGFFLIIFGLNMLNIFPVLRKLRFRTPKVFNKILGKDNKSPLIIGLLNGLMIACGPLQAIYIMAAGTGSMIEGGKILFLFAIGTLPVMLGFGIFATFLSKKATTKLLKASGIIVIVLGLLMVNRGLALTGSGYDINSIIVSNNEITGQSVNLLEGEQIIEMDVTRTGFIPNKFVLKKGVPVKWKINGKELTGCNNAIQVPSLDLEFDIKEGKQIIEFTPTEVGVISWSCWMGMIPGSFIVKDDVLLDEQNVLIESDSNLVADDNIESDVATSCGGTVKGSSSCGAPKITQDESTPNCDGSCGSSSCGVSKGGSCGCGI